MWDGRFAFAFEAISLVSPGVRRRYSERFGGRDLAGSTLAMVNPR